MIEFIAALYNEQNNLPSLIAHIEPFVGHMTFVDDGSTDETRKILQQYHWETSYPENYQEDFIDYKTIEHTGLPEVVKAEALKMVEGDPWILMLDADERFAPGVLYKIQDWIESEESKNFTHVWFNLEEAINGQILRQFIKCRLFRKSAVLFSDNIHVADSFSGNGASYGWTVLHYKTSAKQIQREQEYIATYDRLVNEGKMTPQKRQELKGMHYFIK